MHGSMEATRGSFCSYFFYCVNLARAHLALRVLSRGWQWQRSILCAELLTDDVAHDGDGVDRWTKTGSFILRMRTAHSVVVFVPMLEYDERPRI